MHEYEIKINILSTQVASWRLSLGQNVVIKNILTINYGSMNKSSKQCHKNCKIRSLL